MAAHRGRTVYGLCALFSLTVLLLVVTATARAGQTGGQGTGRLSLSTAHCLAHCFTRLNINPTADKECQNKPMCKTCIHMCELLQTNPTTWRPVCGEQSCNKGCMTACSHDFRQAAQEESRGSWELAFPPSVTLIDGGRTLFVHWRRPRPTEADSKDRRVRLVYLVMERRASRWTPMDWTLTTHARIALTPSKDPRHFRLVAVGPRDVAVNVSVPEVSSPMSLMSDQGKAAEDVSSGEVEPWNAPTKVDTAPPGVFHSAHAVVRTTTSGQAEAVVTWEQRLRHHLSSATYVITWSRRSCDVKGTGSHCPLPSITHSIEITARRRKTVKVTLRDLTFNSDYTVDIGFPSFPTERLLLATPRCPHPDSTYRRCQEPASTQEDSPAGTTPISLLAKLQRVRKAKGDIVPTEEPQGKVPIPSGRTGRLTVAAVLAGLVGVTTVCVAVGVYVIYRRWVNNKQAEALRSYGMDPRVLWTPGHTLSRDRSPSSPDSTPSSPGSYRRNPLASLLSPDVPRPQEEEDVASPGGPSETREGRAEMWTLLGASGHLQHLTRTPDHAHSTPEPHSKARLIRKSSASPIQGDAATPVGFSYHLEDLREDLRLGHLPFRPRLNAHIESDSDSESSSDDLGRSVVERCALDFSTSLRLSALDVDCFSDSDSDDHSYDRSFTASCSTTSAESSSDSSSEEGSFRLYTLEDAPYEELTPFVTSGNSGISGQETLREEIKSVLLSLDTSYDSYFA